MASKDRATSSRADASAAVRAAAWAANVLSSGPSTTETRLSRRARTGRATPKRTTSWKAMAERAGQKHG